MLRLKPVLALATGQTLVWGTLFYAFGAILARRPTLATGISVALLAWAASAPLVGRATARFGPRKVMQAGAALGASSLAVLALGDGALPAFALLGVAQAMTLYEPAFAAVVAWYPDTGRRRRALVVLTVLGALAGPIFIPLATASFDRLGWMVTMGAGVAACAAAMALFASLPDGRSEGANAPPRARRHEGERTPAALVGLFAVQSFVAAAVTIHLATWVGMLAALAGFAQIGGRVVLAAVPTSMPARARVSVLLVLQAASVWLLAASPIAGVLLFGITNGALTVERPLVVVEWVGESAHLAVLARLATAAALARAGAPAAVSAVIAATSRDFVLGALGAATLLAVVIFFASFGPRWRLWRRAYDDR